MIYIFIQNQVFWEVAKSFERILIEKFGKENIQMIKEFSLENFGLEHWSFIFGGNVYEGKLPNNYVLVQLEQSIQSRWFDQRYLEQIKCAKAVLDYSFVNFKALRQYNSNYYCFSIGYDHILDKPRSIDKYDYDVIFLGQLNLRRDRIINRLKKVGLNVKVLENSWGEARDNELRRAKVIINLHYYDLAILEIVRLSNLLSLGLVVVSEKSEDLVLDSQYSKFMTIVDGEQLINAVQELVYDHELWKRAKDKVESFRIFETSLPDKLLETIQRTQIKSSLQSNDILYSNDILKADQLETMICNSNDIAEVQMNEEDNLFTVKVEKMEEDQLPDVSIVTLTRNRKKVFPLPIRNILTQKYPLERLEWIIVDDSDDLDADLDPLLDNLPHNLRIIYIKYRPRHQQQQTTFINPNLKVIINNSQFILDIGDKRNIGCDAASSSLIAFMDDDDYYYPLSLYSRVAILNSYPQYKLVGVADLDVYETGTQRCARFKSPYLAEASMMFHKSFWEARPFTQIKLTQNGEGHAFTKGRRDQLIKMPSCFNMIAITHNDNYTGRVRKVEEKLGLKSIHKLDLFKSLDLNTKLFLFDIWDN